MSLSFADTQLVNNNIYDGDFFVNFYFAPFSPSQPIAAHCGFITRDAKHLKKAPKNAHRNARLETRPNACPDLKTRPAVKFALRPCIVEANGQSKGGVVKVL